MYLLKIDPGSSINLGYLCNPPPPLEVCRVLRPCEKQQLYVIFLDARKAFDRVCYSELFNILLDKKVCPQIVQLLCYMYLNQACCVKGNSKNSTDFTVSNGVKQGVVISLILFSVYMDILFKQLKHNGIGCHVGPVYAGTFG